MYAVLGIRLCSFLYTSLRDDYQQVEGQFTVLYSLTSRVKYVIILPEKSLKKPFRLLDIIDIIMWWR